MVNKKGGSDNLSPRVAGALPRLIIQRLKHSGYQIHPISDQNSFFECISCLLIFRTKLVASSIFMSCS